MKALFNSARNPRVSLDQCMYLACTWPAQQLRGHGDGRVEVRGRYSGAEAEMVVGEEWKAVPGLGTFWVLALLPSSCPRLLRFVPPFEVAYIQSRLILGCCCIT